MGRQRRSGPDPEKVSVLLPSELDQQVEDFAARRKWAKSHVLRHLIELGLVTEQQQASPVTPQQATPQAGQELAIRLTAELWACIELAAGLHGLEPAALVQQMVGEHITTYIAK